VSKETYISVKRDLYQCQKRPISGSQETYHHVKRDLLSWSGARQVPSIFPQGLHLLGLF